MEELVDLWNETSNLTTLQVSFTESVEVSSWIKAVKLLRNICVPVIAGVGIVGNTLSCLVFTSRTMKRSACSVFLASLAFVDCLFLLCLILNWLDGEIKGLITTDIACQFLIFVTYVTSFLSVWFIVGFTFERFIAICHPLKSVVICSVFREKIAVGISSLVALILYNFSFWTSGMQLSWTSEMKCSHKMAYFRFLEIITWVDTFVTVVLPFILISTMNYIVMKTVLTCPLRHNIKTGNKAKKDKLDCTTDQKEITVCEPLLNVNILISTQSVIRSKKINPKIRVTRTLMFVSLTFLCLNLPSHVVRLYNLISSVVIETAFIGEEYFFLQEVAQMFYYVTFSCNFFLYTLFGRNFKKSLYMLLKCKHFKRKQQQHQGRRVTSPTQASCLTSV